MPVTVRLEVSILRHKKFQLLDEAAFAFWSAALLHSREQNTDGFLDDRDLDCVRFSRKGKKWVSSNPDIAPA